MKKLLTLALCSALMTVSLQAVAAKKPLADRHGARGVPCTACHKAMPPKAPANGDCFACHQSYEALAKRTDKKDINPHGSHVEDPACADCHSGHKKPRLLCDQCHEFTQIKVP